MKAYTLCLLLLTSHGVWAQTKTTETVEKKYNGLKLYFYKNTLRMLNQKENPEFDELIKDIEKMKFLMVDKTQHSFTDTDYKKLKKEYKSESYEEMMTSRYQGRNFDVYIKESAGRVKGTVILANDSTHLYVLDILGSVALNKATSLFQVIDGNADIGKKIANFMGRDEKKKKKNRVKID
ncbi:MAG: DUF4252 domain-containing protein [Bacteroidetes bacterium]|nr:DUF4252 domain-containing protein [Bacteroidota bacterium]